MSFNSVSECKLLELQFKILHDIYPTATSLKKMKIKASDTCDFCGEIETPIHFFILCETTDQIWTEAEKIVSNFLGFKFNYTEKSKLFGIYEDNSVLKGHQRNFINKVNLIVKIAISRFKFYKNLNVKIYFANELKFRGITV